jgi:DNA-directed RNA polymerase subunit RPC12/RpoP
LTSQFGPVTCGHCGAPITEDPATVTEKRAPCPNCGSTKHKFAVQMSATVEAHTKVRMKARHGAGGRPFMEQIVGSDFHRNTGIWMRLERVIDRAHDWYRERITNPKTGEVVHESEEPLSQHRDHGAAKQSHRAPGDA